MPAFDQLLPPAPAPPPPPPSPPPKDGTTIIATGGWYEIDGQRVDNAPSLIAWKTAKWVMMDDYGAEYHDPKQWAAVP